MGRMVQEELSGQNIKREGLIFINCHTLENPGKEEHLRKTSLAEWWSSILGT